MYAMEKKHEIYIGKASYAGAIHEVTVVGPPREFASNFEHAVSTAGGVYATIAKYEPKGADDHYSKLVAPPKYATFTVIFEPKSGITPEVDKKEKKIIFVKMERNEDSGKCTHMIVEEPKVNPEPVAGQLPQMAQLLNLQAPRVVNGIYLAVSGMDMFK